MTALSHSQLAGTTFRIEAERLTIRDVVALQEKKAGSPIKINYETVETAMERVNKGDFQAYLKTRWAEGTGIVGTKEELSIGLYPEWNPKKVADFV